MCMASNIWEDQGLAVDGLFRKQFALVRNDCEIMIWIYCRLFVTRTTTYNG